MDEFLSHTLTDWSLIEKVCETKSISNTVSKISRSLSLWNPLASWLHQGDLAAAGQSGEFIERTHQADVTD